jgi:hypothetical protein
MKTRGIEKEVKHTARDMTIEQRARERERKRKKDAEIRAKTPLFNFLFS